MDEAIIRRHVSTNMGRVVTDLHMLVSYPSLAFEGYDPEPNHACAAVVERLVKELGVDTLEMLKVGPGFPVVWGEIKGDPEAPTVLLYAHYDVQPAPAAEQGWIHSPWQLTEGEDGRLYGRGAADDKGGIVQHLGAVRALGGARGIRPLNLKICIEGEEEAHGHLMNYIATDPDRFKSDVVIVADSGNLRVGEPILTTSLRGDVNIDVTVRTMNQALHSGIYGGPTPDALVSLVFLLRTMFDNEGNTVIEGIKQGDWLGAEFPEDLFKEQIGLVGNSQLKGSGSVASRLWAKASASIIGIDAPSIAQAANIVIPEAKARVAVRFPSGQPVEDVLEAVKAHLLSHAPWGVEVSVSRLMAAPAFEVSPKKSSVDSAQESEQPILGATAMALEALTQAFEFPAAEIGCGASIPLLSEIQKVSPHAEFLLFGPEDLELARIHGGNESVDPVELERCILAESLLLQKLIDSYGAGE